MSRKLARFFLYLAVLACPVLAQKSNPELLPGFSLGVVMPTPLVQDLSEEQIKNDIELILRRNGIGLSDDHIQVLQLVFKAARPEDREHMAVYLRLELFVPGLPIARAWACSGKPIQDPCREKSARIIGYWGDDRLMLISGSDTEWRAHVRDAIRDLTEKFALFYLRKVQTQN